MNTRLSSLCASVGIISCLASCQSQLVQVVDAKSRNPIVNANVRATRGDISSPNGYTDRSGLILEPTVPGGASQLVVSKDGYTTKYVKLR